MKTTLGNLFNSVQAVNKLSSSLLPTATAYRISKLLPKLNEELGVLRELYKKHSSGDSNPPVIAEANKEKFTAELEELTKTESELEFTRIKLSELSNVKLTALDFRELDWLIENDID